MRHSERRNSLPAVAGEIPRNRCAISLQDPSASLRFTRDDG